METINQNKKKYSLFKKIIISVFGVIGALALLIIVLLLNVSPGKLSPIVDANGVELENSISEKLKVNIGGMDQGMFIVGENKDNPVLLYLHGGPGAPEYPMASSVLSELSKEYTVCTGIKEALECHIVVKLLQNL